MISCKLIPTSIRNENVVALLRKVVRFNRERETKTKQKCEYQSFAILRGWCDLIFAFFNSNDNLWSNFSENDLHALHSHIDLHKHSICICDNVELITFAAAKCSWANPINVASWSMNDFPILLFFSISFIEIFFSVKLSHKLTKHTMRWCVRGCKRMWECLHKYQEMIMMLRCEMIC